MKIIARFEDSATVRQCDRATGKEDSSVTERQCSSVAGRWLNRAVAVLCILVWTYLCLHIGAFIERQGAAEQEDLFLRHYAQKMEELKQKEQALIHAVKELKKRRAEWQH